MARSRTAGPRADFFLALVLGILLTVVLSWLPFVGPFIAGLLAGIVIDGSAFNGIKAGLLSALFGSPPVSFMLELMIGSHLAVLGYLALIGLPILIVGGLIAEIIGGAIGGQLRHSPEEPRPKNPSDKTRHP